MGPGGSKVTQRRYPPQCIHLLMSVPLRQASCGLCYPPRLQYSLLTTSACSTSCVTAMIILRGLEDLHSDLWSGFGAYICKEGVSWPGPAEYRWHYLPTLRVGPSPEAYTPLPGLLAGMAVMFAVPRTYSLYAQAMVHGSPSSTPVTAAA